MDRREFLKKSAGAVVGMSGAALLPVAAGAWCGPAEPWPAPEMSVSVAWCGSLRIVPLVRRVAEDGRVTWESHPCETACPVVLEEVRPA